MRILLVTQGEWGERIAQHLARTAPPDWELGFWKGPTAFPLVIDEPGEFLPERLEAADLLLALTESPSMTDLVPDMARLCGARAAIVPVDRRAWAPPGLVRQVQQRLQELGIASAFPMPFCSLRLGGRQHALIQEFARRYGHPQLDCLVHDGHLAACEVRRETPCGNTRYMASHLVGVPAEKAAEQAGLLHHYYPCWGGMDEDPVHGSHTLLHVAATIALKSVERALAQGALIEREPGHGEATDEE